MTPKPLQLTWTVPRANDADLTEAELETLRQAYHEGFPEEERRPWRSICTMDSPSFRFVPIRESGELVGFVTLWHLSGFVYVEHLLVLACSRGGGVGARVVQALLSRYAPLPIVLEVEPEEMGVMACRRIGFYRRLGLSVQSIDYIQPPYTPQGAWVPLRLMSCQDMPRAELERVARLIHREVYGIEG